MERFLFENVWRLLVLGAILQFLFICLWSWTRHGLIARSNWVCLFLFGILVVLSVLITTPAEQIIETCRRISRAIDDGDVPIVESYIADDFQSGELDRAAFLSKLERTLTRVRVDALRLRSFEVRLFDRDSGQAEFRATCRVTASDMSRWGLPTKWRVSFRRTSTKWRVTRIESLPVPPMNHRTLTDWFQE